MEILFFCPMWGLTNSSVKNMLIQVKESGYDGIEFGFPINDARKSEFYSGVQDLSLLTIGQQYGASGDSFLDYKNSFINELYELSSFRPLFINSQTGKDFYSFDENATLILEAAKIEKETGIPIIHETHRGKFPFCINATTAYIKQFPELRFAADYSHFCTVSESYLHNQQENLELISKHSCHIHARVGHPQGPQITDPRLPEWKEAVDHHLGWWDTIVSFQKAAGAKRITITPEFGPEPYMFSVPGTKVPIADQWEINLYMMKLLRARYN